MFGRTTLITVLGATGCAAGAAAQDAPELVSTHIDARAIEKPAPRYPSDAQRQGREGWVILSYVVSEDGGIIEPMIEDSSGGEDFERAALEAVQSWRYEPARLNDEPTEQSLTQARIVFVLQGGAPAGASRPFLRRYREIAQLMEDGAFEQAEGKIIDLQFSQKHNLYEDAWFWWLRYQYLQATGSTDTLEMRDTLRKALGYEEDYLAADQFVAAAQQLYNLSARAMDFSAAIDTFERLRDSKTASASEHYAPTLAAMQSSVEQINALVDGPGVLEVGGRIGEHGYWVHELLRRSFSLAEIDGMIETVDIRCERGTTRYSAISNDDTWTVPDAWGACGVYIKGTEGTAFDFLEYPSE